MSKIQDIENKLMSINPAAFQELCDSYLSFRNENYRVFSRLGSQAGKQKTVIGTPDTFFLLNNNKYIFVEYSTNITKKISKLQEDILKCLDVSKTGIPIENISEIIICINFKIDTKEVNELNTLVYDTGIKLTFYTLDSLAMDLCYQRSDLVQKYLNITLDTGQIVPIETFISQYNKATQQIATPLDNPFFHREEEQKELINLITDNDILLIYGSPGIGKTKLVLETIKIFINKNHYYDAFCISNKNVDMLDDLHQFFNKDKNYILFVDDVNRIDRFKQILGYYSEHMPGKFKILLTVRDYAYNKIVNMCQEYKIYSYKIEKLTDEHIKDIIKEKPFNIMDYQYQKDIISISDGNPRLAIMAAMLANDTYDNFSLNNISDLFERYFSTFINADGEFSNPINLKILGLIAFFYTIPINDKELLMNILDSFQLDYNIFINNIDKLDRLELIEIHYDYVRIPEQNIATFFFYKTFIKDSILSFDIVLRKYFESNSDRFTECVIYANNIFGYQNVIMRLKPILTNYWNSINDNEEKSFQFLTIFWFCLQDEFLEYLYNNIKTYPEVKTPVYEVDYSSNNKTYKNNNILGLLKKYYYSSSNLKNAIELSFELVRKLPDVLPELINNIKEILSFQIEDSYNNFSRQFILFNILINGLIKKDILLTISFFEISKYFLPYRYNYTNGGRGNTIEICNYSIPNSRKILEFRKNIWENINKYFTYDADISLDVLENYLNTRADINNDIMKHDMQYIINIINNHLTPKSFQHCKYVQEQILIFKRNNINYYELNILKSKFINHLYKIYIIINWDKYRDKDYFDFENSKEYEDIKESEIRNNFIFNNTNEIKLFYNDFIYLYELEKENSIWKYNNSLDIIIDENCNRNIELGCQLIIKIIENNLKNFIPYKTFHNHLITQEKADYIWNILQKRDFKYKPTWELIFYDNLSDELINEKYISAIKNSYSKIDYFCTIFFDKIQRFFNIDENLIEEILLIIVNNNKEEVKIYLWENVFEIYFKKNKYNIKLIEEAYLQQTLYRNNFDHNRNIMLEILKVDSHFLLIYIKLLYEKNKGKYHIDDDHEFGIVWNIDNIEPVMIEILNLTCENENYFHTFMDYCNSFFWNLELKEKERAKLFIFNYININYNNVYKINIIVNIIRHAMKEYYEDILLYFLSFTQDKELFSKISWRGNITRTFGYDDYFGDIEASDWKNILSIIEKSDLGIELIPIKQYINLQIDYSLRMAEQERRMRYFERR